MRNGLTPTFCRIAGEAPGWDQNQFRAYAASHRHHPFFSHTLGTTQTHSTIRTSLTLRLIPFTLTRILSTHRSTFCSVACFHIPLCIVAYRIGADLLDDGQQRFTDCRIGVAVYVVSAVLLDCEGNLKGLILYTSGLFLDIRDK